MPQRQQQNVAKLKADARNLVGIIGSDKTKTQTQNRNDQQRVQMARSLFQAAGNDFESAYSRSPLPAAMDRAREFNAPRRG